MKQLKRSNSGKLKTQSHIHYFPNEILNNILSRLPLKSLLRFQCVEKSWKSIITDPSFKLNPNSSPNSYSILRSYRRISDPPQNPLHIDRVRLEFQPNSNPNPNPNPNPNNNARDDENLKKLHQFTGHHVFGSSNALICFGSETPETYRDEPFYLWNPGLNRCKKVPPLPPIPMDGCSSEIPSKYDRRIQNVLGLGFCGIEGFNDYKLVRVSFHHRPNLGWSPPNYGSYCRGHLNVYSLKSDSWKNIPNVDIPSYLRIHNPKFGRYAVVGRVHYWLINLYNHLDHDSADEDDVDSDDEDFSVDSYSLVGFDLVNETFLDEEVKLPKTFWPSCVDELYVFELNGSLALYEAVDYFRRGCLWVSSSTNPNVPHDWSVLYSFEANNLKDLLNDERLPFALQMNLGHDREIGSEEEFYFGEVTSYDGIYVKSLALLGVPGGVTGTPYYEDEYDFPLTEKVIDVLMTESSYQDSLSF